MTHDFFEWTDNIKISIEKRVGLYAHVSTKELNNTIAIVVDCVNGMRFYCTFDQVEFYSNKYHQRRSLVKVRRENMIREMKDHCVEIMRVAKKLR